MVSQAQRGATSYNYLHSGKKTTMLPPTDPSGYYAALGVDPSATSEQIKRAFKAKARESHPDRNSAPEATQQFQFINEAYQVLGDPQTRAEYDAHSYETPEEHAPPSAPAVDPVVCSVCLRATAQPRYAIYKEVASAVFATWRRVHQGIFCPDCGAKVAYRASLKTWLLGWWGFPWGPIRSIQSIVWNMRGGEQPCLNNLRILSRQAAYFAYLGRLDLAGAVARSALAFWDRMPVKERIVMGGGTLDASETRRLIGTLTSMVAGSGTDDPAPVLRDLWGLGSKAFKVQLAGAAAFAILFGAVASLVLSPVGAIAYRHTPPGIPVEMDPAGIDPAAPAPRRSAPSQGDTFDQAQKEQSPREDHPSPDAFMAAEGTFNQPLLPLPSTGEIRSLRKKNTGAVLAPLTVVTANGSPNYYLKLVDSETHVVRLVFFVRSGKIAKLRVPLGSYELRYAAGAEWYGEEYLFGPGTEYAKAIEPFDFHTDSDRVLGFTVELIKQINGNLREVAIRASDF